MHLTERERYLGLGLTAPQMARLELLGDRLLEAGFNVTSIDVPEEIERIHILDSLSLLSLPVVNTASTLVDVGSGAGLPALVIAVALSARVVALESQRKKCSFIEETAKALGLDNLKVACARAEEHGRGTGRGLYDVAVSRALASLPTVIEYSLPLLRIGGTMVAMRGRISDQERIQGETALGILGGGELQSIRLEPFPGAANRWVHIAAKLQETPEGYPRRVGVPTKRPLGA